MLKSACNPNRVLVIEDEHLIQLIAADMLDQIGLQHEAALNAAEALSKLQENPQSFAAAVVDFGLPDRSGTELLAEMSYLAPNLPLIVATGRSVDRAELSAKHRKLAFLPKPYDQQQFEAALRSVSVSFETTNE